VIVTVRRALATAAATAVLLALAGCGDDDSSTAKSSSSASSASSSASDEPSSTASATGSAGAGEEISPEDFAGVLKDALDEATTAHVAMELGGAAGTAEGDTDYTKSPPEIAMTMTLAQLGGDVEVRMVAGTMYMKSATFGDKWVSVPLDDPSSPLGSMGDLFDVTKTLEGFANAVTSATRGTEDVDGESLDHYTATVDTQKLLASMPELSAAAGTLPKTVTQEWWFDEDGLIRKFSGDFGGTSTAMTFSDWGEDVSIEAPPADQVTTMPGATS